MTAPTMLIAAGGTGGHVFPALAVAQEMLSRGFNVEWVGAPRGIENRVVPEHKLPLHLIGVAGLRGNGVKRLFVAPLMLLKAMWQAGKILRTTQPAVVLGMGGFASGPACMAARLRGVPVVIHEQNAIPGLTNSLLARVANKALEGFDGAFLKKNITGAKYTGNPVRNDIAAKPDCGEPTGRTKILIVGGSLGAVALNDAVPSALALIDTTQRPQVWHQCGKGRAGAINAKYQSLGLAAEVSDFIDDMSAAYAWADIIICRAGAMTVAEVAVAGLPAIFVPYPHAVDDHQTHNANWLVEKGAARLIAHEDLGDTRLASEISELVRQPQLLVTMRKAARDAAKVDATMQVADVCEELARG